MLEKFITLKHWKLFAITVGVPVLIQIVFMIINFVTMFSSTESSFDSFDLMFKVLPIGYGIGGCIYFLWVISIVLKIGGEISSENRPNRIWFSILISYTLAYYIFFTYAFGNFDSLDSILPFHFLAMLTQASSMFLAGRIFKSAELNSKATLKESLLYGLFFYMLPVGIWILHKKIVKLRKVKKTVPNSV
ncbi:MAG: hypothetical protein ACI9J3_004172 [Parvicellaceae bacterium]|jgi:hypothetical protein